MSERRGAACAAGQLRRTGPLRDVLICHCADCRRWHGHAAAMTSARRSDVTISAPELVAWFTVAGDCPRPRRGFCSLCGASLFWDAPERSTIGIAAGTLEQPTGLRSVGHVYVSQASDYECLVDDGLLRSAGAASPDVASPPS